MNSGRYLASQADQLRYLLGGSQERVLEQELTIYYNGYEGVLGNVFTSISKSRRHVTPVASTGCLLEFDRIKGYRHLHEPKQLSVLVRVRWGVLPHVIYMLNSYNQGVGQETVSRNILITHSDAHFRPLLHYCVSLLYVAIRNSSSLCPGRRRQNAFQC